MRDEPFDGDIGSLDLPELERLAADADRKINSAGALLGQDWWQSHGHGWQGGKSSGNGQPADDGGDRPQTKDAQHAKRNTKTAVWPRA